MKGDVNMIYVSLRVLEEINECKHEIEELDRVLKEITKPELREYLCDQRAWFVNKLSELNIIAGNVA
jgi:hypothetical protein